MEFSTGSRGGTGVDKLWKSRGLTEVQQGLTDKILGKPNELTEVVGDVVRFLGWPFLAF